MSLPSRQEFPDAEWERARLEVLSSVHEDDYGVWEVLAGVNGAVPGLPAAHLLRLTQAVVLDVLQSGWATLSFGRLVHNEPSSELSPDQWPGVLTDTAAWDPFARGEGDPYHSLSSTPAGVEAYYELGQRLGIREL